MNAGYDPLRKAANFLPLGISKTRIKVPYQIVEPKLTPISKMPTHSF